MGIIWSFRGRFRNFGLKLSAQTRKSSRKSWLFCSVGIWFSVGSILPPIKGSVLPSDKRTTAHCPKQISFDFSY